jgi:hypothetical protein
MWSSTDDLALKLSTQDAIRDSFFGYIDNNIRAAQNWSFYAL